MTFNYKLLPSSGLHAYRLQFQSKSVAPAHNLSNLAALDLLNTLSLTSTFKRKNRNNIDSLFDKLRLTIQGKKTMKSLHYYSFLRQIFVYCGPESLRLLKILAVGPMLRIEEDPSVDVPRSFSIQAPLFASIQTYCL